MHCVDSPVAKEWNVVYKQITNGIEKSNGKYRVRCKGSTYSPNFSLIILPHQEDRENEEIYPFMPNSERHALYSYETYKHPYSSTKEIGIIKKWLSEHLPWYRKIPSYLTLPLFTPLYLATQLNKYSSAIKKINEIVEKGNPSYYMNKFEEILQKALMYVDNKKGKLTKKDIKELDNYAWELHKIFLTAAHGAGCHTTSSVSDLIDKIVKKDKISEHLYNSIVTGVVAFALGIFTSDFLYRAPYSHQYQKKDQNIKVYYYASAPIRDSLSTLISPLIGFYKLASDKNVDEIRVKIEEVQNKETENSKIKRTATCRCTYNLPKGTTIFEALKKEEKAVNVCIDICTGENDKNKGKR